MFTGELLASGVNDVPYARDAAALTDLTLIYNAHVTAAHAVESTSHVPPDSMVFLEGFDTKGTNTQLFSDVNEYTRNRLYLGTSDPRYQDFKAYMLWNTMSILSDYQPKAEHDNTAHLMAELLSLVEKDCAIRFADYTTPAASKSGKAATSHQDWLARMDFDNYFPRLDIGRYELLGRRIGRIEKGIGGYVLANFEREHPASMTLLETVWEYAGSADTGGMLKTHDGRLVTSMIYGNRHRTSLAPQLERHGVSPRTVELTKAEEWFCLDPVEVDGQTGDAWYPNFRRRVGFAMLWSLARQSSMGLRGGMEYADSAYDHLTWLNESDEADYKRFVGACADAVRTVRHDKNGGDRKLLDLMDAYLPDVPMPAGVARNDRE